MESIIYTVTTTNNVFGGISISVITDASVPANIVDTDN